MKQTIFPIPKTMRLQGALRVPGDKSISHRALILAALARDQTLIRGLAPGRDVDSTIRCLSGLGVHLFRRDDTCLVRGQGLYGLKRPSGELDAGNSGTTLRLLAGVLAAQPFDSVLTGDASLRRRPMKRILDPLNRRGARIFCQDGYPPLRVSGSALGPLKYGSTLASAQVKSCVLLSGLYAAGETVYTEPRASRDHTERLLTRFGVPVKTRGRCVCLTGPAELNACRLTIPGDISSAAFFMAAALLLPNSDIYLTDVGLNPTRLGWVDVVRKMGGRVDIVHEDDGWEPRGTLRVRASRLRGVTVEGDLIPRLIDELPILAVLASQAHGETVVRDAAELRVKETDRIEAVVENLGKLGVPAKSLPDGFRITGPASLRGGECDSFGDHRTAMAMAVAGLKAESPVAINGWEVVGVSCPAFLDNLRSLIVE